MVRVYLSLGSNLGDRDDYLRHAREAILEEFPLARFSQVYETEPVDFTDQPWFLNQVAEFPTDRSAESLLEWASSLEAQMGRQRVIPKGPRTLDLDILLYGDKVIRAERLPVPHPRLAERRHVLAPLMELAADLWLPDLGITVRQALEKTQDKSQVKIHAPA